MSKSLAEQLEENQAKQFDQNMQVHTLVGNLMHWRTNAKNKEAAARKVLLGRMKILNLVARFKV